MGIWIRSQNKKLLMNLEYFEIQEPNYEEVKAVIFSSGYILGGYSTKEKALKVLDEIEKKIIENNTIVCNEKEWSKYVGAINCVFQMPDDEE